MSPMLHTHVLVLHWVLGQLLLVVQQLGVGVHDLRLVTGLQIRQLS